MNDLPAIARANAVHCEAKKHAYRQTQDGVVVSFVLHPQEVPDGLTLAPLGTRFMVALVAIDDNEQPKGGDKEQSPLYERPDTSHAAGDNTESRGAKRWNELSPAQQAGIRANDITFRRLVSEIRHGRSELPVLVCEAEEFIRSSCAVSSRADIKPGTNYAELWERLDARFLAWRDAPGAGA